jgi:hypothetical protein
MNCESIVKRVFAARFGPDFPLPSAGANPYPYRPSLRMARRARNAAVTFALYISSADPSGRRLRPTVM